jgi:hypothetical protein
LDQASYVDDDSAEQELLNTLEHLNQQRTEDHLDTLVDILKRTDYAQLTAAEKARLQQLLDRKHSKN